MDVIRRRFGVGRGVFCDNVSGGGGRFGVLVGWPKGLMLLECIMSDMR